MALCLLAHDQIGSVDVVHLLTDALHPIPQQQRHLPKVALGHTVHHVYDLALCLWDYFGISVDVRDVFDLDFHSLTRTWRDGKV